MKVDIETKAKRLIAILTESKKWVCLAESCTGGLLAATLTGVEGSSKAFERGFVTYSNDSKVELLSVNPETLKSFGAVSEESAREMVAGVFLHSPADIALAITGVAGPSGGTLGKPVGTVFISVSVRGQSPMVYKHHFTCDAEGVLLERRGIQLATVNAALDYLLELASAG